MHYKNQGSAGADDGLCTRYRCAVVCWLFRQVNAKLARKSCCFWHICGFWFLKDLSITHHGEGQFCIWQSRDNFTKFQMTQLLLINMDKIMLHKIVLQNAPCSETFIFFISTAQPCHRTAVLKSCNALRNFWSYDSCVLKISTTDTRYAKVLPVLHRRI